MVRPKKHLGQHFLTDNSVAEKIVSYLSESTTHLLEIGPGTGILTNYILDKEIPNYFLIEVDRESVDYLNKKYPQLTGQILLHDFLKFNIDTIFNDRFSIIGNFPYNISSQILFRVLTYRQQVEEVIGMFQKEVAERIASPPGSKKYGILSVLIGAFYEVELLLQVSEHVFSPPPKVKSAVLRLKRNGVKALECNEKLFFDLVKTAFNQRRKTLRNALSKFRFNPGNEEILSLRAEQLEVEKFIYLVNQVVE
ncbi:MAG: 16S rRNA (adenine(1518)-N(6)/adenine(1519)-N(6))-dimethyltransferase RsmA [Bacteroidales bacterium]|nr:16S rRNA (adenine(1518)-N(6)/adenine(1519)-N(6))-dimethyltransferase RsmA [Bacteroidales bacterium]MCF8402309.1 16S rRNA (adenine(1518)-N(6)/adenine(1519)-N(6))-dimethyltransferase RsmA [Bacteroidales bacterium]